MRPVSGPCRRWLSLETGHFRSLKTGHFRIRPFTPTPRLSNTPALGTFRRLRGISLFPYF